MGCPWEPGRGLGVNGFGGRKKEEGLESQDPEVIHLQMEKKGQWEGLTQQRGVPVPSTCLFTIFLEHWLRVG